MERNMWKEMTDQKVAAIDLDGVLVDYPRCWIDYINQHTKNRFKTLTEAKQGLSYFEYKSLKRDYRKSGIKASLPAIPNASVFTKCLRAAGFSIIILTARNRDWENRNVVRDTYRWLELNKIAFDDVIFDKQKHIRIIEQCPNLKFMVEDNHHIANVIGKFGYRVYVLDSIYNRHELLPTVVRIKNLKDILMCEGIQND